MIFNPGYLCALRSLFSGKYKMKILLYMRIHCQPRILLYMYIGAMDRQNCVPTQMVFWDPPRQFLFGQIESSLKADMKKGRRVNLSIVSRCSFSFSRVGIDPPLRRSELSKRTRTMNRKKRWMASRLASAVATTTLSGSYWGYFSLNSLVHTPYIYAHHLSRIPWRYHPTLICTSVTRG